MIRFFRNTQLSHHSSRSNCSCVSRWPSLNLICMFSPTARLLCACTQYMYACTLGTYQGYIFHVRKPCHIEQHMYATATVRLSVIVIAFVWRAQYTDPPSQCLYILLDITAYCTRHVTGFIQPRRALLCVTPCYCTCILRYMFSRII